MWTFEKRFVNAEDLDKGPLYKWPVSWVWFACLTLLIIPLFFVSLSSFQLVTCLILWPILSRLIALDLTHLILPDIYTLPLLILGLALALLEVSHVSILQSFLGAFLGGGFFLFLAILLEKYTPQTGIGGGDIKLIAVAGAFLGLNMLPHYLWISCALAFVLYFFLKHKNKGVSFGPALILGLWALLLEPQFIEKLIFFFS